jgi:putative phage-type endonuclease
MTARLLMTQEHIDRDRQTWQYVRRQGVTASEIPAVLGIANTEYSSAFDLFVSKQTGQSFQPDTEAMSLGTFMEPYIADRFEAEHDYLKLLPGGLYCHEDRPWQMATFDRLAVDMDKLGLDRDSGLDLILAPRDTTWASAMPVQIKTSATMDEWGEPRTRSIPAPYLAQTIWEMDVQGADTAWVPVLFWKDRHVVTYIIERDEDIEADIEVMRIEAAGFLDRLKRDDPPPIDWSPATARALKAIHPDIDDDRSVKIPLGMARRYRKARIAKAIAKQRLGQVENEIRGRMGSAKYAVVDFGGKEHRVMSRTQFPKETIDVGRLRQTRPEIAKEYTRTTTVDQIYPGSWVK